MLRISSLILTFLLFIFASSKIAYALPNKWCSSGKYSAAILPFPKQSFQKCPVYANVIIDLKDVERYYLDGIGRKYFCNLLENPQFFSSTHRKQSDKFLKKLFIKKQILVAEKCNLYRTQIAKKKSNERKQKVLVDRTLKPKEWCIGAGQFGKKYPIKKRNGCPTHASIEITESEALRILLSGTGQKYLSDLIESKAICQNDKTEYKFLRKLLSGKKDLGCQQKKILAKKKAEEEPKIRGSVENLAKEEIPKQLRKKGLTKKKENQKSSQNKLSKTKEEALFVVKVLKEYVQTDNDLDILEIGDLLNSYTTQVKKGWSDKTISSYDKLFKYASSDKNFIKYLDKKKTEQKQKYEREVLQLKNEIKSSQKLLSNYIKKNLGTDEANSALELAKKAKSILKKFNYKEAIQLKVKISKWKSKNGFKKNNKKEKTKIKRVVSKSPNVSNIKKEKGKYPEFLKDKYWFKSKSVNGYSYKNGVNCKKIVKDMKNDWLTFFNFNKSNVISYSRSNEEVLDGFRFSISAYEKNRNFIFGYSIKNGNGYKKNTGYTIYSDTEVPDEIIIHENFNTGSLKRIMLYNQKHQILVGKKIIETIDKDVEEDTFKVRFNWCSGQPPKVKLALSDEQVLEKLRKNDKVKPKNNKNRLQTQCVPYGAKEDTLLNNLMAKKHKGKCMHATYGKMYYENKTRKMEQEIICHYSNGVKVSISAPLYYSLGCSRYIN